VRWYTEEWFRARSAGGPIVRRVTILDAGMSALARRGQRGWSWRNPVNEDKLTFDWRTPKGGSRPIAVVRDVPVQSALSAFRSIAFEHVILHAGSKTAIDG
jgi:hypothetical protein